MNPSPRSILSTVRTLVVKLGTQLLTDPTGQLDVAFIEMMATQIVSLRQRGLQVTIVSSGAIGAGLRELKLAARPKDLGALQAVAAVGQRRLMDVWAAAFAKSAMPVAQVLLTREDIDDRARFLNLRNMIHAAHELGAIPIINENDTISTDELVKISFGDNDTLAALVTHALSAQLLVLLSVVDGLLDAEGNALRLVENIADAHALVRAEKSPLGTGGFGSKLGAARMISESGEAMIIAHGRMEKILPRLLDGEELGTLFLPAGRKLSSRSRWIGSVRPAGTIIVDDGAARALAQQNRSLLPAGIVRVEGSFDRGDVVAIQSADGILIGRGLCNYSSAQVELIRGKRTQAVRELLAEAAYDEVVHRDNLLTEKALG